MEANLKYIDVLMMLFVEAIVDRNFGKILLEDYKKNPPYNTRWFSEFIEESEMLIIQLDDVLNTKPVEYSKLKSYLYHLQDRSSLIGAVRLVNTSITFTMYCAEQNIDKCNYCLGKLMGELDLLKESVKDLFEKQKEILDAGGRLLDFEMIFIAISGGTRNLHGGGGY